MLEYLQYLIKERVAVLKASDTYDIHEAESGEQVGTAKEEIGSVTAVLRWVISKRLMPTKIEVREPPDGSLVFTISRSWYLFRARVEVRDSQNELVGYFRSKVFTIGGGFHVYDRHDRLFAEVKGTWTGFHFRFRTPDGTELGEVSKKFEGLGKEMFTSADTYRVTIAEALAEQPLAKMLLLAAALAIDIVFKEE